MYIVDNTYTLSLFKVQLIFENTVFKGIANKKDSLGTYCGLSDSRE